MAPPHQTAPRRRESPKRDLEADEADCEAATVRKPHPADFGPRKWRKGSY